MIVVDYEILVQEIVPPIGGVFTHFATLQFLVVETKEGRNRLSVDLGETHGKSSSEAREKMQKKFDAWVEENCDQNAT